LGKKEVRSRRKTLFSETVCYDKERKGAQKERTRGVDVGGSQRPPPSSRKVFFKKGGGLEKMQRDKKGMSSPPSEMNGKEGFPVRVFFSMQGTRGGGNRKGRFKKLGKGFSLGKKV